MQKGPFTSVWGPWKKAPEVKGCPFPKSNASRWARGPQSPIQWNLVVCKRARFFFLFKKKTTSNDLCKKVWIKHFRITPGFLIFCLEFTLIFRSSSSSPSACREFPVVVPVRRPPVVPEYFQLVKIVVVSQLRRMSFGWWTVYFIFLLLLGILFFPRGHQKWVLWTLVH